MPGRQLRRRVGRAIPGPPPPSADDRQAEIGRLQAERDKAAAGCLFGCSLLPVLLIGLPIVLFFLAMLIGTVLSWFGGK